MGHPTDTQNLSAVKLWVEDKVASGLIKDCTHLKIISMTMSVVTGSLIRYFVPDCDQRSLEWSCPALDDYSRREMLVHGMENGSDIIACPAKCACYESRIEVELAKAEAMKAAAAREKRERRWARVVGPIKGVLGWFNKLPWQTQILIILLVVLFISPRWVPQLVLLIKALARLRH